MSQEPRAGVFGPSLPPELTANHSPARTAGAIGPALPPGFVRKSASASISESSDSESDSSSESATPGNSSGSDSDSGADKRPRKKCKKRHTPKGRVAGPALPPDGVLSKAAEEEPSQRPTIGPVLPPGIIMGRPDLSDNEDTNMIGPAPYTGGGLAPGASAAEEFEQRANRMRNKLLHNDEEDDAPAARETWMLQLPTVKLHKSMGLTARGFSTKTTTCSEKERSVWTETPSDRAQREQELSEGHGVKRSHDEAEEEANFHSARDAYMSSQIKQYNEHERSESLMDLHQKKLLPKEKKKKKKKEKDKKEKKKKKAKEKEKKKEKEKEKEKPERRPFDRDLDLEANKFDEAKKNSIIKRSQMLNSRFGHGNSQFL